MLGNTTASQHRYWTKFVVAVPDMNGDREQDVWQRYQQIECSGPQMKAPCKLRPDSVMYFDTYSFSRYPGANESDTQKQTLETGPVQAASASGFYQTLLENRRWWAAELAAEGMHALSLPSPASTNGTQLVTQFHHNIIQGMITWPVFRLFPPCALVSHAQGSSGVVDTMPFAWRGHTQSLTTRARPSPDLAVWLE